MVHTISHNHLYKLTQIRYTLLHTCITYAIKTNKMFNDLKRLQGLVERFTCSPNDQIITFIIHVSLS